MPDRTFVVAGAGVAAATAVDTLRSEGFDGRLILIGRETAAPYNRPALSKERLRGEVTDEQILFHPADYYRSKQIELLLEQEMSAIEVRERQIRMKSGGSIAYDALLLATGAEPQTLDVPGGDLEGVYYLRSLHDSERLSTALQQRPRLLVIGGGFIGCEVAASARTLGCEVTLLAHRSPLTRALGAEIGEIYASYHRGQGVEVKVGAAVERFEGHGRVEAARLSDETSIACDVVVIGIGVAAATGLLRNQPVEIEDGILVDEFTRSSVTGVFAAGDVASSWNPRFATRLRVEHFDNAQLQGAAAAKSMLGAAEPYNPIPSFWSDQYTYKLQYRGYSRRAERVIIRGRPDEGSFSAFYTSGGVIDAICSVNRYKENYGARPLIGARIDAQILQDDSIPVKELAAIAARG